MISSCALVLLPLPPPPMLRYLLYKIGSCMLQAWREIIRRTASVSSSALSSLSGSSDENNASDQSDYSDESDLSGRSVYSSASDDGEASEYSSGAGSSDDDY